MSWLSLLVQARRWSRAWKARAKDWRQACRSGEKDFKDNCHRIAELEEVLRAFTKISPNIGNRQMIARARELLEKP